MTLDPATRSIQPLPAGRGSLGPGAGFASIGAGARIALGTPRLLPWLLAPPAAAIVIYAAIAWFSIGWIGGSTDAFLASRWGEAGWLQGSVATAVRDFTGVGIVTIAYFTFGPVAMALAGPFMEPFLAEVDRRRGTNPSTRSQGFVKDLAVDLWAALTMVLFTLGVSLLALPLNLVPVVGNLAYASVMAWLTGIGALDPTLGRLHLKSRERRAFFRQHRAPILGFGAGVYLLFLVPVLGWFLCPAIAVTSGAALVTDLENSPFANPSTRET